MYLEITGIKAFEILDWSFKLVLLLGVSLLIVSVVLWVSELKKRRSMPGRSKNDL